MTTTSLRRQNNTYSVAASIGNNKADAIMQHFINDIHRRQGRRRLIVLPRRASLREAVLEVVLRSPST